MKNFFKKAAEQNKNHPASKAVEESAKKIDEEKQKKQEKRDLRKKGRESVKKVEKSIEKRNRSNSENSAEKEKMYTFSIDDFRTLFMLTHDRGIAGEDMPSEDEIDDFMDRVDLGRSKGQGKMYTLSRENLRTLFMLAHDRNVAEVDMPFEETEIDDFLKAVMTE